MKLAEAWGINTMWFVASFKNQAERIPPKEKVIPSKETIKKQNEDKKQQQTFKSTYNQYPAVSKHLEDFEFSPECQDIRRVSVGCTLSTTKSAKFNNVGYQSQFLRRLGETESQQQAQERREDREDRATDAFEAMARQQWRQRAYQYVQDQAEYPTYPGVNERPTPPSDFLQTSHSGSGSGSGSGYVAPDLLVEHDGEAYITVGQPTHQFEMEDYSTPGPPPPVAYPTSGRSQRSSTRHAHPSSSHHASSAHTRSSLPSQQRGAYTEEVHPAPLRDRRSTRSLSDYPGHSSRPSDGGCCCIVM